MREKRKERLGGRSKILIDLGTERGVFPSSKKERKESETRTYRLKWHKNKLKYCFERMIRELTKMGGL